MIIVVFFNFKSVPSEDIERVECSNVEYSCSEEKLQDHYLSDGYDTTLVNEDGANKVVGSMKILSVMKL